MSSFGKKEAQDLRRLTPLIPVSKEVESSIDVYFTARRSGIFFAISASLCFSSACVHASSVRACWTWLRREYRPVCMGRRELICEVAPIATRPLRLLPNTHDTWPKRTQNSPNLLCGHGAKARIRDYQTHALTKETSRHNAPRPSFRPPPNP